MADRTEVEGMNYRHAFHAGNHADVLKHVVLSLCLVYLARKAKPFRVIDAFAGAGLYDLGSAEAVRSPEWVDGIGRLLAAPLPPEVGARLAEYMAAIAAVQDGPGDPRLTGKLLLYPGSPAIARHFMRPQDRLSAVELHPADHGALTALMAGDPRTRVHHLDGWLAIKAQVPPKERRGLVLIDPPFERPGEFDRMVDGLKAAHRRWPTGMYLLWSPRTAAAPADAFHTALAASGIGRILSAELMVRPTSAPGLCGSGMVIINPPYTLDADLQVLLPVLAERLSQGGGGFALAWLAGET